VSGLVLVILVTFIRCSCAVRCYNCESESGDYCDDPLDKNNRAVRVYNCTSTVCGTGKGTAICKNPSCQSDACRLIFIIVMSVVLMAAIIYMLITSDQMNERG